MIPSRGGQRDRSIAISAAIHMDLLPIPLHLPFMFLALLAGSIQALVFFLLSMIYIQLVLPHHEEERKRLLRLVLERRPAQHE